MIINKLINCKKNSTNLKTKIKIIMKKYNIMLNVIYIEYLLNKSIIYNNLILN